MSFSRPNRLPLACTMLALLTAASLLLVAAGRAQAGPLRTGITNTGQSSLASFETVRRTGSSFVRIPLDWNSTVPATQPSGWDPTNPAEPAYDWSQWDDQVRNSLAAGVTPILQLGGAPRWAQGCAPPASYSWATCDPDPAALRAFAIAAARHYSGDYPGVPRVVYWQILNEPNLSLFFLPQYTTEGKAVSPWLYRRLLNATYEGIKSVDSRNLVLLAGLGPIAVKGYTIGPMSFARKLLCMKGRKNPRKARGNCEGGVHFDIFAIQPYTTGGPTHTGGPDDVELGDLGKLRRLISAADRAKRIKGKFRHTPLWITEFSWDTKPPDPGGLPMKVAKRWVAEALFKAWRAHVSNFLWYSLDDAVSEGRPQDETYESGLFFADGKPKPIITPFRFPFVAYPGKKLFFWGRTPSSRRGKVRIQIHRGKRWKTVKVARADKHGIFRGRVGTGYGRNKSGAVRAVFGKRRSAAFSMRPVRDFYHPPFG